MIHPDAILRLYLAERESRRTGGVPSVALWRQVAVSSCCGTVTTWSKGRVVCLACRRPCDMKRLDVPRASLARRSIRWAIRVRESRSLRPGQSDARAFERAVRWLLLQQLVEARPRDLTVERWNFDRLAWECSVQATIDATVRLGNALHQGIGQWTEWTVREAVREAREVVEARAERRPAEVRTLFRVDRAS